MSHDFLVIGAGMAGASAGYELAAHGACVVLERENAPGYHSTGRSAALYTEAYGNRVIRALARGGRPFMAGPPGGFAETPILTPRGMMFVGRADQRAKIDAALAAAEEAVPGAVAEISAGQALDLVPVLDAGYLAFALHEPGAMDIDVHAMHQGFLRGLKARGGELLTDAEALSIEHIGGIWRVHTPAGDFAAPILVNAAGAWADVVAELAGARLVGLVPKRRTALIFDPPAGVRVDFWPATVSVAEDWYFRPDAGRLMASPADETPVPPQDAQPEEIDLAEAAHRIEAATTLKITRIVNKWAGLRSFVADKSPVAGFAPDADGFVWLAGQGGYGIKTAPALARITAALVTGGEFPADLAELGLSAADLAPERLWA